MARRNAPRVSAAIRAATAHDQCGAAAVVAALGRNVRQARAAPIAPEKLLRALLLQMLPSGPSERLLDGAAGLQLAVSLVRGTGRGRPVLARWPPTRTGSGRCLAKWHRHSSIRCGGRGGGAAVGRVLHAGPRRWHCGPSRRGKAAKFTQWRPAAGKRRGARIRPGWGSKGPPARSNVKRVARRNHAGSRASLQRGLEGRGARGGWTANTIRRQRAGIGVNPHGEKRSNDSKVSGPEAEAMLAHKTRGELMENCRGPSARPRLTHAYSERPAAPFSAAW